MNTVQDKYAPGDSIMVYIDPMAMDGTTKPVRGYFKQDLCFGRILVEVPHFIYKNIVVLKGKKKYKDIAKEQLGERDAEFIWWNGKWQLVAYRRKK